ncbi:MAG: hypothetical protein PHC94_10985 [Methylobacter sp.]|nr:hypothetical protein [Methylococcales bacterium]MDD5114532.1 hypothetical protein [Methylobacter sp.]
MNIITQAIDTLISVWPKRCIIEAINNQLKTIVDLERFFLGSLFKGCYLPSGLFESREKTIT